MEFKVHKTQRILKGNQMLNLGYPMKYLKKIPNTQESVRPVEKGLKMVRRRNQ